MHCIIPGATPSILSIVFDEISKLPYFLHLANLSPAWAHIFFNGSGLGAY